jgi:hypothetical protein
MNTTTSIPTSDGLPADDEMLFVCPDREATGFVPSER